MCGWYGTEKIVEFLKILVHGLAMKQIAGDEKAVNAEVTTFFDYSPESGFNVIGTILAPGTIRVRRHPPVNIRCVYKTHLMLLPIGACPRANINIPLKSIYSTILT
jgi:hypothetical protein